MKGSIRKRGKTYTYIIDLGRDPLTNKRIQKSKGGFKTKKDCQVALAKIQTEYHEGTYVNESEILMKDFVDKWFEIYKNTPNLKPSTLRTRRAEADRFVKNFKKIKLKDVTSTIYQDFLLNMQDKYSRNTIEGTHAVGRMVFEKAIDMKYIKQNPTVKAIVPKANLTIEKLENEDKIPTYFEKDELLSFLEGCKKFNNPQSYITFLLLSYTGMRGGELCALRWKDIDLENQIIKIYKTYFSESGRIKDYVLLTPKTKSSIRNIYIDDLLVKELKKHKAWQNELKLKIPSWHDDFVITNILRYAGYPTNTRQLLNDMNKIIEMCNLPKITPHGLRHTHTSLLAQAGVGLEEIMERLGHRNDDITRNIYLHVTEDMKKEATERFTELMQT